MSVVVQGDKIHSEKEYYRIVERTRRSKFNHQFCSAYAFDGSFGQAATVCQLPARLRKLTLLVNDARCHAAIPTTI
jgi:hypothetical protein